MNDEEQWLRIFHSSYFEIKCNNDKKDSFEFFYQELFLPWKYAYNINRITELNCWAKGIVGVVMSFAFVGTCLLVLKKQWETSKIHVE